MTHIGTYKPGNCPVQQRSYGPIERENRSLKLSISSPRSRSLVAVCGSSASLPYFSRGRPSRTLDDGDDDDDDGDDDEDDGDWRCERDCLRGVSVRGGRRDTGDDDERWVEEEELKEQSDRTDVDKVKGVDLVSGDSCWWCRRPRRYVRGVVCRARTAVLGRGVDS